MARRVRRRLGVDDHSNAAFTPVPSRPLPLRRSDRGEPRDALATVRAFEATPPAENVEGGGEGLAETERHASG